MSCMELDHIALTVESLRQAENLYKRLFELNVVFREGLTEAGRARWDGEEGLSGKSDTCIAERSCLESHGMRIMLILKTDEFSQQSRIDHVCLKMPPHRLARLLEKARSLDCQIDETGADGTWIEDPYGVRWRVIAAEN